MGKLKPTVAIYDEFLTAFAALPRTQQRKVNAFLRKFRQDPTQASIHYEHISTFRDQNLRTVRIDLTYRAVVLAPDEGRVFVLLWVDHHDEAIAWARNKRVEIHRETGALQVLEGVQGTEAVATEAEVPAPPAGLFARWADDVLVSLGLPDAMLPEVRALVDLEGLETAGLPPELYEALFYLATGESVASIREALGLAVTEKVDTTDFAAAIDKPSTRRRFALVTDDEALAAMLDQPLDRWRVFLHPSQHRLVSRAYSGPARVLGGAGTGKTVVAMHRARALVQRHGGKVLFTTFTANLADDIQANLKKICTPEELKLIEVVHLDRWVSRFLKGRGYAHRVLYWPDKRLLEHWEDAVSAAPTGFSKTFLREEWEQVVQAQGCTSFEDYRGASRRGRGQRLSRRERRQLWPVYQRYRDLLDRHGLRERQDALWDAARLLDTPLVPPPYRAAVVDEAQDMSTVAFRLIRSLIPPAKDDLFIVGDGHQRIYRRKVVLSHAGIQIVGRSRKLRINYRTPEEIRRAAVSVLEGWAIDDLDGGSDDAKGYVSLMHGVAPTMVKAGSFTEEVDALAAFAQQSDTSRTCLVCRTGRLLDDYEQALTQRGLETLRLSREQGDDRSRPGLRLATMHRVKGLEFDRVMIAGLHDWERTVERLTDETDDTAIREEAELGERALLYVSLTRARKEVMVSWSGSLKGGGMAGL